MFQVTVIIISVLLTATANGLASQGCIPKHCTCTVNNTTAIPAQPFNVDDVDWRPIMLATGLGTATSSLVLTTMAVWWMWKSSSMAGLPDASSPGKPTLNPNTRSVSPSASSDGSWATQRNRYPQSDQDWSSRLDSRGSDGFSSSRGKSGKRVWPGQFD